MSIPRTGVNCRVLIEARVYHNDFFIILILVTKYNYYLYHIILFKKKLNLQNPILSFLLRHKIKFLKKNSSIDNAKSVVLFNSIFPVGSPIHYPRPRFIGSLTKLGVGDFSRVGTLTKMEFKQNKKRRMI